VGGKQRKESQTHITRSPNYLTKMRHEGKREQEELDLDGRGEKRRGGEVGRNLGLQKRKGVDQGSRNSAVRWELEMRFGPLLSKVN